MLFFRSFIDNHLLCDCKARAFLHLLNAKTVSHDFNVQSGSCVGTKLKLTEMKDDQFGICTGKYIYLTSPLQEIYRDYNVLHNIHDLFVKVF